MRQPQGGGYNQKFLASLGTTATQDFDRSNLLTFVE